MILWHRVLAGVMMVGVVGSGVAPVDAAMNWGRDRVLLSGKATGGGGGGAGGNCILISGTTTSCLLVSGTTTNTLLVK